MINTISYCIPFSETFLVTQWITQWILKNDYEHVYFCFR